MHRLPHHYLQQTLNDAANSLKDHTRDFSSAAVVSISCFVPLDQSADFPINSTEERERERESL